MTLLNLTSQVTWWIKIPTKLGHIFLKNKTKPYVKAYKSQPTTKKPFFKNPTTQTHSHSHCLIFTRPNRLKRPVWTEIDRNGPNGLWLTDTLPSLSLSHSKKRERERERRARRAKFLVPYIACISYYIYIYIRNSIICHIAIVKNGYASPPIYVLVN